MNLRMKCRASKIGKSIQFTDILVEQKFTRAFAFCSLESRETEGSGLPVGEVEAERDHFNNIDQTSRCITCDAGTNLKPDNLKNFSPEESLNGK